MGPASLLCSGLCEEGTKTLLCLSALREMQLVSRFYLAVRFLGQQSQDLSLLLPLVFEH
jgi:hypothetical protein